MAVESKSWGSQRGRTTSVESQTETHQEREKASNKFGAMAAEAAASVRSLGGRRLAFLIFISLNIALNATWVITTREGLKDLGSFLHSGAAYYQGVNPYSYQSWLLPHPISVQALNLNPPISVYGFDYLSRLPASQVEAAFLGGSLVLLALSVGLLMAAYPEKRNLLVVLAVISLAGVWHMVWYLQLYAPLILAMTCAWLLMRRGNLVMAGVMLGLVVAIKPNFGVVILALLLARHYRVALPAFGTAAAISAVPLAISGPEIYRQWLELVSSFDGLVWTSNASIVSAGARLHMPAIGYALAAMTLAVVFYWQWRMRPPVLQSTAAAVTTAVLIGPVSWAGYTLFLLPYLFSKPWDRRLWLAVVMLDMPFAPKLLAAMLGFNVPTAPESSLTLITAITASVYVWAMVLLMHHTLTDDLAQKPAEADAELAPALAA